MIVKVSQEVLKSKCFSLYNIEQELEAQDIFYTSSKHYATLSMRASDQTRERLQMLQCLVLYANIVCTSVGHCKTSEYTPSPPHNVSHPVYKHTIFINAPSFTSPWAYFGFYLALGRIFCWYQVGTNFVVGEISSGGMAHQGGTSHINTNLCTSKDLVIGRPVPVLVTFCVQIYVEQLSSGTRTSIELCIYGIACLVISNLLPYTSLKLNYMNITLIN
jgi:hypothetical protein